MNVKYHMVIAFTLAVALVSFGVLLSPPFKDLRKFIGFPEDLPGSEVCKWCGRDNQSRHKSSEAILTRIAHVYHAVFAVLIYATVAAFIKIYRMETDVLLLMLTGVLMVVVGSLIYSYIDHTFFWHGLFIAGLAVIFSSALLLFFKFKPSDELDWAVFVAAILLLGGALIGGWIGSNFIDSDLAKQFLIAKIQSRFNPDLAEENVVWRAMTGHLHAMVALSLVLTFLIAVKAVEVRLGRLTHIAIYAIIFGEAIMALASYSVWFVGKIAHLVITPAALALIFGTLILSFRTKKYDAASPKGTLSWELRLGNIWIWAFVVVPGAIVALSLRKPKFISPEFRADVWDWAELAYSIGHWHILLAIWGITLLLLYLALTSGSRLATLAGWVAMLGMLGSTSAINLYMLANSPKPYTPNPYDNFWLQYLVEPSMVIMSVGVAVSYFVFLREVFKD